jgi:thymidylate synthase
LNHLDQIEEQLARDPYGLCELKINKKPASIFDYEYEDFELVNYQYHPRIKAPVAV